MQNDMTTGSIPKILIRFSLPYLLSCFLQTFYGLADLFITSQYNGAAAISAVSIGSQVMHMLTVIIMGLAMGATVTIGRNLGAKKKELVAQSIGNTISLFLCFSVIATVLLICAVRGILTLLSTPAEAIEQARQYLLICFVGVPFITAYNVLSSVFRGMGDSRRPMYFVAIAGVLNVIMDFLFIGAFRMGAAGAALATVISQTVSVLIAFFSLGKLHLDVKLSRNDFHIHRDVLWDILKIGIPIACQDGFIQISFLVITAIANSRGVTAAASVGIVEKIISFLFLVDSAMLSSISAIAAQNVGANAHKRSSQVLAYGIGICLIFGLFVTVICEFWAEPILSLFAHGDEAIILAGSQYLRSYVTDCIFAGIHFCFSGYFCAYGKAQLSFIQNVVSIILIRIPGAYLASLWFPDTLFPMGMAAPAGSLLSALICVGMFAAFHKKWYSVSQEKA